MTPPPNYDTALQILARSHESVLGKLPPLQRQSSASSSLRRFFSFDIFSSQSNPANIVPLEETGNNTSTKPNSSVLQTENDRLPKPEESRVPLDVIVMDDSSKQESRGSNRHSSNRGDNQQNRNQDISIVVS